MYPELKIFIILTVFVFSNGLFAQETDHQNEHNHTYNYHKLTGMLGYAFIDNSFSNQSNDILIVPAIGLNYDYIFKSGWGLGVHSDMLLQQFKAESHGNKTEIIRENPIALLGLLLFKPNHSWTLSVGYGTEFEKHENLQLLRVGLEYGMELPKNWELGFSLEFDYKPNAYNSLLFGINFVKLFSQKSK